MILTETGTYSNRQQLVDSVVTNLISLSFTRNPRTVSANDLTIEQVNALGNATGAVFNRFPFVNTGEKITSNKPSARGRKISVFQVL